MGGSSTTSTTTTTPDYEYNARMANIAEKQLAMSDDLYNNIYKSVYLPYDTAVVQHQTQALDSATDAEISSNELATAQNRAAQSLIGGQTDLAASKIAAQQNTLNAFQNSGLEQQYLNALQPTGSALAAGRATASVQGALDNSLAQLQRSNARMGIDPNSGATQGALRQTALSGAAALGGAANTARLQAKQDDLNKLAAAANYGAAARS